MNSLLDIILYKPMCFSKEMESELLGMGQLVGNIACRLQQKMEMEIWFSRALVLQQQARNFPTIDEENLAGFQLYLMLWSVHKPNSDSDWILSD